MGDKQLGLTGTLRQNRLFGIPLPSKKEAEKKMKRGESQAVYSQDSTVILWKDNKPVYMASNFDQLEPMGSCQRYSKQEKGYVAIPQPSINSQYNRCMGGVDLVDNAEKNYAITTRSKKWYWAIYAWFLNLCMVQAWRLYRAHMRNRHLLAQEKEKEDDEKWEEKMKVDKYTKIFIDNERKEREKEKKRRRQEEKKTAEIPLLEFTRQVVVLTVKKHGEDKDDTITSQSVASAKLSPMAGKLTPGGKLTGAVLQDVRYDSGRHLPKKSTIQGVCKECKKRSIFRCTRCKVVLHAECFYTFHTPENEQDENE
jgi:hypothetical protein